jgi:hypothetical protein
VVSQWRAAFPLILTFSLGEKEPGLLPAWKAQAAFTHPAADFPVQRSVRRSTWGVDCFGGTTAFSMAGFNVAGFSCKPSHNNGI